MIKAYSANRIFTGEETLHQHAVLVENEIIIDILPQNNLPENIEIIDWENHLIAPSFIDIQIYGAEEKLFSVYPTVEALKALSDYCKQGGALHFMPTVATNTYNIIKACIDAVKQYWQAGGNGCLGLHIEGPWINPSKRGAHVESLIHSPTIEEVKALLDYGKDVIKIITIAPEVCSDEVIRLIQSYGIIISAGHSNATFLQANQAFDKNIQAVTHLYNAMSGLQHREPGLVGATFLHKSVMASIVADGHHVDFNAIKIAYQQMKGRLFCITDAVTTTNEGAYPHEKSGDKYVSNKVLSGSSLTMEKALQNLVKHVDVEFEEALRMVSLYPAKVLGISNDFGKIKKGFSANFIALNNELEVVFNSRNAQ